MTKGRRVLLLAMFFTAQFIQSRAQVLQPKFEFRGVWVATVANIDWPSKQGLPVEALKKEVSDLLDFHRQHGINVVVFQVRPCSDAFYSSSLEPWSRYLTGTQGKSPEPFWDPLQYWIEECHKRDMELHAWLNPYRVAQNASEPLAANHVAFKNPHWVVRHDNKLYFDPGVPETRLHVARVVSDIVRRYDIDAIHMDDYFYPYPTGEAFPDDRSFSQFNRAFKHENKGDWRRENVDILIKMTSDSIKSIKPWVKFGISPFGVWRNRQNDEEGSDTRAGVTNYDHLYADIRKWLSEGWIDYVVPQIYWETGHPAADFETLCRWWNRNSFGRGLYIGHAVYKADQASPTAAWRDPGQLPAQVRLTRKFSGISGNVFFSSRQFKRDLSGFQDSLAQHLYRLPSLTPPMPWLQVAPPGTPVRIRVSGRRVIWHPAPYASPVAKPQRYLVYLNEEGAPFNEQDESKIVQVTRLNAVQFNRKSGKRRTFEVRISALDRLNNESKLSDPVIIKL